MKKKILSILLALTIVLLCSCGKKDDNSVDRNLSCLLPKTSDYFGGDAVVTITDPDGGDYYMFEITGYNIGQYANYIKELQNIGWTDVVNNYASEDNCEFGAYTGDGKYWVSVSLDDKSKKIYVMCNVTSKK